MILASILSGAVNGSSQVTVGCNLANGNVVCVHRGTLWLGSAPLVNGQAVVTVPALGTLDVIQASVTERGNQAGLPLIVSATARTTGWMLPDSVSVTTDGVTETLTQAAYQGRYGSLPPAYYDPSALIGFVAPDYDAPPTTATAANPILFDVKVEWQTGQTVVTVTNVVGAHGLPLIRWSGTTAYGNSFSKTFTAAATIVIGVRGEDDATPTEKTVIFDVFSPPAAPAPQVSDIIALAYQSDGSSGIFYVNSTKACECRLDGVDAVGAWVAMNFYGVDFQQRGIGPIPIGDHRFYVRVAGDADSTHWRSFIYTSR